MSEIYWPFPTSKVSEWPGPRSGSYHTGTDFAVPQGTPLRATVTGTIVRHNNDGLGAYVLDIIRDDGLLVRNGHLSRMDVVTGQRVTAGQVIGLTGGARGTAGAGNSFGPHLHWELRWDREWNGGKWVDPRNLNPQPRNFGDPQQLAANQRQAGSEPVNRRLEPNTSKPPIEPKLAPGTVGDFNGWIHGESVNGNSVWFRGAHSGNWFWSGGFTSQSTAGLEDLNPKPQPPAPPAPVAGERTVGANPVRRRKEPKTSAAELTPALAAGSKHVLDGWAKGEKVTDSVASSDVWYHHSEGWWAWAGAFTAVSTVGLKDMTPAPAPEPTPEPTPEPPKPEPTPTRKPVSETTPNWDASSPAANPVYPVPEPKPTGVVMPSKIVARTEAVSLNGYTIGRPDPKGPNHIVLHHAATTSLSGAVNTLRGTNGAPTANYVVKDSELIEMVPEGSSAWTNGRWTSNLYSVTFELVNSSGSSATGWFPPSAETCETTAHAMARAAQRWNFELPLEVGVNVFGHRDVSKSATACPGSLDIKAVVKRANEIIAASPVPTPQPPAAAVDLEGIADALDTISAILRKGA